MLDYWKDFFCSDDYISYKNIVKKGRIFGINPVIYYVKSFGYTAK